MAIRASAEEVRAVVPNTSTIDIAPFISAANALTDYVNTCDTAKDNILTTALLLQIEIYLAAHFYAIRDQQYQQKKTGDASATFQGQTGMRLDSTTWGQAAMTMDISGCLSARNKGGRIGAYWLGKAPSAQTDYVDRD